MKYQILTILESLMVTYMVCNLLGLSSTCTNPTLYGYINQNLQQDLNSYLRNIQQLILDQTSSLSSSVVSSTISWFPTIKVLSFKTFQWIEIIFLSPPFHLTITTMRVKRNLQSDLERKNNYKRSNILWYCGSYNKSNNIVFHWHCIHILY